MAKIVKIGDFNGFCLSLGSVPIYWSRRIKSVYYVEGVVLNLFQFHRLSPLTSDATTEVGYAPALSWAPKRGSVEM